VSAPRVFVPNVSGAVVQVPQDEAHHVLHVLRLTSGDPLIVFDGRGGEWDAQVLTAGKSGVSVQMLQGRTPIPDPRLRVTLAIGLLKGHALDDVMRDATVLGVAEIIPMITAHCVVPKKARGDEAVARWDRIAVAAAKQCGRATLPLIHETTAFMDVVRRPTDLRLMCLEPEYPGSERITVPLAAVSCTVLVGPEGGWSPLEVATAQLAGYQGLQLGPRVLRAELAPIVALSQLWASINRST
jgi:16S rRNA (uracil1498-N3)-methyltransferase